MVDITTSNVNEVIEIIKALFSDLAPFIFLILGIALAFRILKLLVLLFMPGIYGKNAWDDNDDDDDDDDNN